MKRFSDFNGSDIDYESFFQNPDRIENKLVYAIRNRDKESRDEFLSFIHKANTEIGLYVNEHHIRVEKNIPVIIDLIWANHWETEEWDKEAIFEEDFKKICRIPFYIPFICMELLSGEYIMHLLHPDTLKLTYRTTCPPQEAGEPDDLYKTRCNAEISKRKNDNLLAWIKRFEQKLSVSFDQIFPDKTKRGRQRAGTIGEQFFEEYGYAAYEINKDDGKTAHALNLLERYDEPYVNNIGQIVFGQDSQVLEHCDGLVLFKTILFQHLRPAVEDRCDMAQFLNYIQHLVRKMIGIKNQFEVYLASISEQRKLSPASEDTKYREQMEDDIKWIMEEIKWIEKIVKNDEDEDKVAPLELNPEATYDENQAKDTRPSRPVVELEPNSLYETVLWEILLLEMRAVIMTIRNTFFAAVKSHSEIEKLHQYIRMSPSLPIRVNTWEDFKNLFSEQLDEFFPCANDKERENLWLLAIKTIVYCDSQRFHLPINEKIPKKLNKKWLKKIDFEQLPAGGLFATMLLLDNAKQYKAKQKDIKTRQKDGTIGRKKVYESLLPDIPQTNELTLYKILKNLEAKKATPPLILHVRQLTRESISGHKLREQDLAKSREVFLELRRVYENIVDKAGSFDVCRRNTLIFLRNLDNIAGEIKTKSKELLAKPGNLINMG